MRALARAKLVLGRGATLGTLMADLAEVHGRRPLVTDDTGASLTYVEAARRVDEWAGGIRTTVEPGDRVVVNTANRYEQLLLCLAAARAGCIAVPVNSQMRPTEVDHVVADAEAALVLRSGTDVDGHEPLGEAVPADPDAVAALFYTSGTTGEAKGAQLSHRSLLGASTAGALWLPALHRDELVYSLPIAHIMGFTVLVGMACLGVPVYLLERFRADAVLDAIETRRATMFIGVPAMYQMLVEAGAESRDLTSVRIWGSGADAMPPELARRFKKMGATVTLPLLGPHGEAAFVEGYGMVEVGGGVATKVSPPLLDLGLGSSLGLQRPGYQFRVVDDEGSEVRLGETGELWVRGPGVLKGYWNAPDATAHAVTSDGWLRTGDLVRRGPMGTVMFVGRQKDVIKHGGYSVYALEVQEALQRHPAVLEAAVVGLPDLAKGEVPVAAVRLAEGTRLDALDLPAWASEQLARYKVPQRFVAVAEIPHTGTNKVDRRRVLELF
jgi:acyl-CoA synthetase (AMP-forming)/AMP-acid ligase II